MGTSASAAGAPGGSDGANVVVATFNLSPDCFAALEAIASACGVDETAALHIAVFATAAQLRRRLPQVEHVRLAARP